MRYFMVTFKAFTDMGMEYTVTESMQVAANFECLVRDEVERIIGSRLICVVYQKEII